MYDTALLRTGFCNCGNKWRWFELNHARILRCRLNVGNGAGEIQVLLQDLTQLQNFCYEAAKRQASVGLIGQSSDSNTVRKNSRLHTFSILFMTFLCLKHAATSSGWRQRG